jgi:glycopeptide antibiotics resistance protein
MINNKYNFILIFTLSTLYLIITTIYFIKTSVSHIKRNTIIINNIFIVYLFLLSFITLWYTYLPGEMRNTNGNVYFNFKPFIDIIRDVKNLRSTHNTVFNFYINLYCKEAVENVILFIPFGIIVTLKTKLHNINSYINIMIFILIPLFIEILQGTIINRSFDIDDIIFNILGSLIGYIIIKFAYKQVQISNWFVTK